MRAHYSCFIRLRSGGLDSRLERLERLNRLREGGALSHAEFEREKARILSSGAGDRAERKRFGPIVIGAGAAIALILVAAGAYLGIRTGEKPGSGGNFIATSQSPPSAVPAPAPIVNQQAPSSTQPRSRAAGPEFPRYVHDVPAAFHGNWDEITGDGCEGREARFYFGRTEFANFEVQYHVQRVKLYSPVEIDLEVTYLDDEGNQQHDVWNFALVNGGRELTGRTSRTYRFRRCPRAAPL